MKIKIFTVSILCTLFVFLSAVLAQSTGTLNGKVTAPDGQPIASASVIVTGPTGATQNAVTGQDGTFTVSNLTPGAYRIDVQLNGYRALSQSNVQVSAGNPGTLNLTLEPGNPIDKVQVQGQISLVQDQDAAITRTYSSASLDQLPIEDLNTQQLVEKMPGIAPPVSFAAANPTIPNATLLDPQQNRVWSTNGQSPLANNQLLDGIENLEPVNGIAAHVPTINSLQEMHVITSNYEADQGRAAGTVLNNIIRGGTNQVHGSLFEFHSDDWFAARNYFDPKGLPQSRFTSNKFGGAAGGPLVRNKTFFFLSYEGDYLRQQSPEFATVPTAAFAAGNFSAVPFPIVNPVTGIPFSGNRITLGLQNSLALRLAGVLPQPNVSGYENNYFANVPFINDGNRIDARLDQHFSDKTAMSLRYGLSYYNTQQDSIFPGLSADGGASRLRGHDAMANLDQLFGPVAASFQLGFTRYSDPISALPSPYSASSFGLAGLAGTNGGLPYIQIAGMPALGANPNYPQINREDTYQFRNTWRAHVGINEFTFGDDFWLTRFDGFQNLAYGPAGAATFGAGATSLVNSAAFGEFPNAYAAFLLGAPTTYGVISNAFVPSYLSWQLGGFASDRIRLTSRLTIDFGIRYDHFLPVEPRNNGGNYSVYNPSTNTLTAIGRGVNGFGGLHQQNLDFAPRVGIAYRASDHTVIRTGYGISYWNPVQFEASALIPAFTGSAFGVPGGYGVAGIGVPPLPSTAAPNVPLYYINGPFRTPYVQFYNFMVQHDMAHGILVDAGYVGNVSRDLPFTQNTNAALPGTGTAGLPDFVAGRTAPTLLRGTGYSSNYNALQLNVTKRFTEGISFSAAYTWSKAEDYGAGLLPFLDNNYPKANFGPSDFDRTHVLTFTHNWRLPFGTGTHFLSSGLLGHLLGPWQIDGILTVATGLPFTPIASSAVCGCPGNTPTANTGLGGSSYSSIPGYLGLYYYLAGNYITSAGLTQPVGTFGSVGRNSFRGPGYTNYDMALTRSFVFVEKTRLDFRAEAYNLTNSSHFTNPVADLNAVAFGQPTSTAYGFGARTLQLALKLVY